MIARLRVPAGRSFHCNCGLRFDPSHVNLAGITDPSTKPLEATDISALPLLELDELELLEAEDELLELLELDELELLTLDELLELDELELDTLVELTELLDELLGGNCGAEPPPPLQASSTSIRPEHVTPSIKRLENMTLLHCKLTISGETQAR
jgi:hypothetical protein